MFSAKSRLLVVLLAILCLSSFIPSSITSAQEFPVITSVTRDACVLTITFTTYERGAHTLLIGDEGAVIFSGQFEATASPQQFTTTYTIQAPVGQAAVGYDYRVIAPSQADSGPSLFDEMEIPPDVIEECQAQSGSACTMSLPAGSVVGSMAKSSIVYWAPDLSKEIKPQLILGTDDTNKTWWVLGQDASHEFYKIAIVCGVYVWVPVDVMGPNYDEVWHGAPLPDRVVK